MSKSHYCENCGAKNDSNALFCDKCGHAMSKDTSNLSQDDSSKYSSLSQFQQTKQNSIVHTEPRKWGGGSLLTGIKEIYTSPEKTAPKLLEDPNAPSSFILVFIMAVISGIFTYLITSKVTYDNINVDTQYEDQYTPDTVLRQAQIAGFAAFIILFVIWWVGSWILGLLIKGGLPYDSLVRYNAGSAMRKLNGYRYVPSIVSTSFNILLLSLEKNRTADVSMQTSFRTKVPTVNYTSNFSSLYLILSPVLSLIATLISVYLLYTSIRKGLNHQGISITIISIIILVMPVLAIFGLSPV